MQDKRRIPQHEKGEETVVAVCPCGSRDKVWVHSHFQCARCGRVLSSCCEGDVEYTPPSGSDDGDGAHD